MPTNIFNPMLIEEASGGDPAEPDINVVLRQVVEEVMRDPSPANLSRTQFVTMVAQQELHFQGSREILAELLFCSTKSWRGRFTADRCALLPVRAAGHRGMATLQPLLPSCVRISPHRTFGKSEYVGNWTKTIMEELQSSPDCQAALKQLLHHVLRQNNGRVDAKVLAQCVLATTNAWRGQLDQPAAKELPTELSRDRTFLRDVWEIAFPQK
eukprot:TRINITY_DN14454_c0_g1_i1.p1 TRINITY_DN14454_c0_g1~~TRINITY_DN14454_c0_g1_i1.p1  ORF type:complete len:219 (+),score=19.13 TRINITY_DN14454_c0_g1_i1:23-658(+)